MNEPTNEGTKCVEEKGRCRIGGRLEGGKGRDKTKQAQIKSKRSRERATATPRTSDNEESGAAGSKTTFHGTGKASNVSQRVGWLSWLSESRTRRTKAPST